MIYPSTYGVGPAYDYENHYRGWYDASYFIANWAAGYNADGMRAWTRYWVYGTGTVWSYFLYDGDQVICELDGSGNAKWAYGIGANGICQCAAVGSAPILSYAFNPQGSFDYDFPNTSSSPAGAQYWDAFGGYHTGGSTTRSLEPVGYCGQWGARTDWPLVLAGQPLILMGHRYYDPSRGAFMTRDPIAYDGGLNLYTYCDGDPVNRRDSSGLWQESRNGPYRDRIDVESVTGPRIIPEPIKNYGRFMLRVRDIMEGVAGEGQVVETPIRGTTGLRGRVVLRDYGEDVHKVETVFARLDPRALGTGSKVTDAARAVARLFGRTTDDAGHVLARNLGGPGEYSCGNIFPETVRLNRGAYRAYEKAIAEEVAQGKEVFVRIRLIYPKDQPLRPDFISY